MIALPAAWFGRSSWMARGSCMRTTKPQVRDCSSCVIEGPSLGTAAGCACYMQADPISILVRVDENDVASCGAEFWGVLGGPPAGVTLNLVRAANSDRCVPFCMLQV